MLFTLLTTALAANEILILDFKGTDKAVTHTWRTNNDPVMGGQSYSTVAVENNMLNFTGACKIVPSLKAPGFITAVNSDKTAWPDVSKCEGLEIVHSSDTAYKGFRLQFGKKHVIGTAFASGFKSQFTPVVGKLGTVQLPFTSFTDDWNDATGAPIHTCKEDKKYCPDKKTLEDLKTMAFWAEGVEGDIHLEVSSVSAYGCK
jgi:hypothetical protein